MSIYDVFSGGSKPFDKEQWAAQKQAQRKEAYELIDNTCSEMMSSGDSFRQYLDVQGRFDRYSVNNAILVSAQMPEATQLKEKAAWKQSRVYVNKDAQKVVILEPSKEYTREDGSKAVGYNAKEVYDISETSAKDRQEAQEKKSMRELVSALIDASPVPFVPVADLEMPAYYDSEQQSIFIRTGLNEEQLFVSMAKEVSAAVFDFKHNESREASEFKSYCVAYMVSSRYGVDTRGFIIFPDFRKSLRKRIRRLSRESLAQCVMFWAKSRAKCIRVWRRTSLPKARNRNDKRRYSL
mgnify:FL=1